MGKSATGYALRSFPRAFLPHRTAEKTRFKNSDLIHLSTAADSKRSDRSWVNIQSAGWVTIQPAPTADIFRAYGSAWRESQQGHLNLAQLKVMSAIEQCRSAALGGHVLLAAPPSDKALPDQVLVPEQSVPPTFVCPHCGAEMVVIESWARCLPIRAPPRSRSPP